MEPNVSEHSTLIQESIIIENSPQFSANNNILPQSNLKQDTEKLSASEVFQKKDKLVYSPNILFKIPAKIDQKSEKNQTATDFPKVTVNFSKPTEKQNSQDFEMLKLNQEINLFRERYLFKLAEISELEAKIKELSDIIDESKKEHVSENKENVGDNEKLFEKFKNDVISQDIGISPIRSLSLTEKTAVDRIEFLTNELEETKKKLKVYQDTESLMKMKLPEDGLQHLAYYEIITGLWRVIECMKSHYNDIIQESFQKFRAKNEILEKRDALLRKKINRMQEIHTEKLEEFNSKEAEFEKNKNLLEIAQEKYKKLKEDHKKLKNEISIFKAECKEKLKKARADIDIREKLDECERRIEELKKENQAVKLENENDKLEFLATWQQEKSNLLEIHEKEKKDLQEEINMLKKLREPVTIYHKL